MSADLDSLVNEFLDARAASEKWADIADELREQIVDQVGIGNKHEVARGAGIRVSPPVRRWSVDQARMVLLPDQWTLVHELTPTLAAAQRNLPADLVDLCRVPVGKARVTKL